MQTNTEREREKERDDMQRNIILPNLKTRLCIQIYLYHGNKDDLMANMFISLYPFYFIILAAKTTTQITNIALPNLKTRLCIQIILVPRKQRRLNGKYVYIIISFLLHYSGCQNRHANYKYKHNTSKLENEAMYTNYTCTTKTKTT